MKHVAKVFLALAAVAITGCGQSDSCGDIVQESYIHKYGVPVSKNDWNSKGGYGQVITKRKDGVTVSQSFDRHVLDGESTYTFAYSDTLARREVYSQGTLIEETDMYPTGSPMSQVAYHGDGTRTLKHWYENGTPRSIEVLDGELLVSGQYLTSKNEVESRISSLDGTRIVRDAYGQLQSKDDVLNGLMSTRTTFHSNGTPKEIIPYRHNRVHGKKRIFLASGEPHRIESWMNGEQTGVTEEYQNGEKVAEVEYISGRRQGTEKKLRNGQEVVEEICWANNERHGPTRTHLGPQTRTDWYFKGKLVSKVTFDELSRGARR